jgi:SAM-dependent methyltransferase
LENGLERDRPSRFAVLETNARAWNRLAREGAALASPAPDEAFDDPRRWIGGGGPSGRSWLPARLDGLKVLCLAAGGGRHGPVYAAAGAAVTVVDLSSAMLELDRAVAAERRLSLVTLQSSMDDLAGLASGAFDIVIHPVSTCYLPDVEPVFREVARVTRTGGLYLSQHKSPSSLQATLRPGVSGRYEIVSPAQPAGPLGEAPPSPLRESGTLEFVHTLSAIVGGICRAGFVVEDCFEPEHARPDSEPGSFPHRCGFLPPYLRLLARRGTAALSAKPRLIAAADCYI